MGSPGTGKIRKVSCSQDDLEKFYRAFEEMDFLPYTYTPSMEELQGEIRENIGQYVPFLLWIDEMGIITKENELEHSEIRNMLKECLVITEDGPGETGTEPGGSGKPGEGEEKDGA